MGVAWPDIQPDFPETKNIPPSCSASSTGKSCLSFQEFPDIRKGRQQQQGSLAAYSLLKYESIDVLIDRLYKV